MKNSDNKTKNTNDYFTRLTTKTRYRSLWKQIVQSKYLYLLLLPVIIWYAVFRYAPMFGLSIAFQRYSITRGFFDNPWVGFLYFRQFFGSIYFWRILRNTLMINVFDVLINFPAPIILALLLNEIHNTFLKRNVQTVSYLPHFISNVVVASMLVTFLSPSTGLINNIIRLLGGNEIHFLALPSYFWPLYTIMNFWKGIGWGSIIYLAAITGVDPQLYEASVIDGAGRLKQTWHITLPGISKAIVVLFILRMGNFIEVGFEQILLLYNPAIYETADVINTYVYRRGMINADYSFATAVGLFQSIAGLILVILTNKMANKYADYSLW